MDGEQFDRIVEERINKIRIVLQTKAREYSYGGDRLSNFRRAAEMQRITPDQAAWNFLVKHLVSIQDMVEADVAYSRSQWDEKLGDAINYLILLEAIVSETSEPW